MIKACREVFKSRLTPFHKSILTKYNNLIIKSSANFSEIGQEKAKKPKKEKVLKTEAPVEKKRKTKKTTDSKDASLKNPIVEASEHQKEQKIKEGKGLDICFLLDCSGSMYHHFDIVKASIGKVVDSHFRSLEKKQKDIRIGLIGYRDIYDHKRFELIDFKPSPSEILKFLNDINLIGGNDNPEDMNGALQQALYGMDWKNAEKIIYHWADGACHGKEFHKEKDDFPDGYSQDMEWVELFKEMKKRNMNYKYFDVEKQNELMYEKLKEIYDKSGRKKSKLTFDYEALIKSKDKISMEQFKRMLEMQKQLIYKKHTDLDMVSNFDMK